MKEILIIFIKYTKLYPALGASEPCFALLTFINPKKAKKYLRNGGRKAKKIIKCRIKTNAEDIHFVLDFFWYRLIHKFMI